MRKIFLAIIFTSIFIFTAVHFVRAQTLPVGGMIINTFTPGVVCGGWGPMYIIPAGLAAPGAFYLPPTKTMIPKPGGQFLGNYVPVPVSPCLTTTPPPIPFVPVYTVPVWGVS